jgi:hypothetical protein
MIDEKADEATCDSAGSSDRVEEAAPSTDPSTDEGVRLPGRSAARYERTEAERLARANSPHKANGRRVSDDLRWIVYLDWKAGTRHVMTLARKHGMTFQTAKKLMQGNPLRNWPSFEAQLALEHETLKTAESIAAEKIAGTVLTEWEKARKDNLIVVNGIKSSLFASVKKLVDTMREGVDFARIEYTKDGSAIRIPMSGTEALANARTAAQAADLLVKIESLLYDKPTERKEVKVEDPWKKLTPEQMEEFARTGELPASVDVEQLFGKN